MSALMADRSTPEDVLRALPLLAHFSQAKIQRILGSFSLATFQKGSFLCRKGTPSPGLLILIEGNARVYADNTSGNLSPSQSAHIPRPKAVSSATSFAENSHLSVLGGNSALQHLSLQAEKGPTSPHPTAQRHPQRQPQSEPQPESQPQSQSQAQSQSQSQAHTEDLIQCSLDEDLGSAAAVAEGTPDPRQGFSYRRRPADAPYSDKATDTGEEVAFPRPLHVAMGTVSDAGGDTVTVPEAGSDTVTGATGPSTSERGVSYALRPGDWFGHPPSSSKAPILFVDVVALSHVTCAFFPQEPVPSGLVRPADTAASSPKPLSNLTGSPSFFGVRERATLLRHPLYFVPSPEELNFILAGKLEQILHLQTLESPHLPDPPKSAPKPGPGSSTSGPISSPSSDSAHTKLPESADVFKGTTPREMFGYPRIFGGQLIGQALMAATRTVSPSLLAHSLHCYFLRPGDTSAPVVYRVERLRDGASFSARRVKAYQGTREIFLFTASFHKPEPGLSSAVPPSLDIPLPEDLLMVEEEEWRLRTTPCLPMVMRRRLARHQVRPMPVELRHCESVERLAVAQLLREFPHPKSAQNSGQNSAQTSTSRDGRNGALRYKPELNVWIRARGLSEEASKDPRLHRCIIGYFSDFVLLGTSLAAHGLFPANPRKFNMASLDHAMWFHEECRADEWLLYSLTSPWSGHARGMSLGRMFTRDGRLVVSTAQEGLIRPLDASPSVSSKL